MPEKNEAPSSSSRVFTLLSLALVVGVLYFAKEILLPLALAVLFSFVLAPLVTRLERLRLGRIPSVVLVVVLACSAVGGVGWLATHQIVRLGGRLPEYKDNLVAKIRSVRGGTDGKLKKAKEALEDISEELTAEEDEVDVAEPPRSLTKNWLPWLNRRGETEDRDKNDDAVAVKVVELPPSPLSQFQAWMGPLVTPLSTAGIVVVLVLFILVSREDLRNRFIQLIGTSTLYATTEAIDDATNRLSGYLRMLLLINTIYGVVVAAGLALIGVPNALLWGVLGILLRFLPYIGPWLTATMPILLSMAVSPGWIQPLSTVALFLVVELVLNNVLEPWLYGSSVGLSSVGVILAAIFWTWLWGPVGLLLAMPLTLCLVVLGNYIPQLSFLPILLGARSTIRPHEQMYQRLLAADDVEASRLAVDYVKTADWTQLYDNVLIPALYLAERDRHAGYLSERQESVVMETTRDLIDDLRERQSRQISLAEGGEQNAMAEQVPMRVLCIPARDHADHAAALMLVQLLSVEGYEAEVRSLDLLVSETIAWVEAKQCDVAVLAVLPPLGSRNGRYLCKRLRQSKPELHIVAALLQGENLTHSQQRLKDCGANVVVTSLLATMNAVRAFHRELITQGVR